MTVGLGQYLAVAAVLFTIGVFGIFVNRKNVIVILMSIELILLAVNINLVAFSAFLHDVTGQIFAMIVLTVAAAEAAVGLAILVTFFRNRGDREKVGEPDGHWSIPWPGLRLTTRMPVLGDRSTWSAITWRRTPGLWRRVSTIAPIMATSSTTPATWKR